MREIKFRALHEDGSFRFYTIASIWENGYMCSTHIPNAPKEPGDLIDICFVPSSSYEQYTGFKDKNGVEIYEGDIVQLSEKTPYIARWDLPRGRFALFQIGNHDDVGSGFGVLSAFQYSIIGNIHQNPELLK